jgi:hypothetical protein
VDRIVGPARRHDILLAGLVLNEPAYRTFRPDLKKPTRDDYDP